MSRAKRRLDRLAREAKRLLDDGERRLAIARRSVARVLWGRR